MRSHRGGGLESWLMAVGFVLLPAFTSTVRAQPGYGPDPFWPYNQQYAPYVSPIGPAGPDAGQGGALMPQAGFRGANQFQDYLDDLQSGGRKVSDRAGIGMPYYRSSVLPGFDATGRGSRQYRPSTTRVKATFEQAQSTVVEQVLHLLLGARSGPASRADAGISRGAARRFWCALRPRSDPVPRARFILPAGSRSARGRSCGFLLVPAEIHYSVRIRRQPDRPAPPRAGIHPVERIRRVIETWRKSE